MNSPIFDPLRLRYAVLGIGLALLLSGLGAAALALGSNETQAVAGHEYTVDSTDDADGDCPLPPAPPTGHCTLRTAIVLANADSDIDVIRFSPELSLPATIKLNSPLTIKSGVTITGPTSGVVTLDGQDDTRHFTIETPASPVFSPVSISNLTLVDGYSQLGGAIAFSDYGGGSDQELSLDSVTIRDSEAFHELYAENSGFGGAIYAVAERSYYAPRAKLTVSLDDVKLVGNLAACVGGAIFANVTTLHIQRSWFEANHNQNSYNCYYQYSSAYESDGGAIRILSKTSAEVIASTFYTNTSESDGGAIANTGVMTVTGTTLNENLSLLDGGAIHNGGDYQFSYLTVVNSTLSGNTAHGHGGAISNYGFRPSTWVSNTTIVDNAAARGGGIDNDSQPWTRVSASNPQSPNAVFYVANSIVAGNVISGTPTFDDCYTADDHAVFASLGHNLTITGTSTGCTFNPPADLMVDPADIFNRVLDQNLAHNGGPTWTHALLPGSPTIDRIPYGINGCGTNIRADQRGVLRPVRLGCDIGAYEAVHMAIALQVTAKDTEQVATRTVTATVTDFSKPPRSVPGELVAFRVTGGTEEPVTTTLTNPSGQAVFTYVSVAPKGGAMPGSDAIATSHLPRPLAPSDTDLIQVWVELDAGTEPTPTLDWFEPSAAASLPTAITLVSFTAQPNADGTVTLRWTTAAEIDNAGFNLYRAATRDGPYIKINDQLIPGQGLGLQMGASYSYLDRPPSSGVYFYKLEDVDYNGVGTFHDEVLPATVSGNPYRLYLPMLW